MRGRKPKPTFLHVVEGTLNATRHADRPDTEPPVGRAYQTEVAEAPRGSDLG
jgi:hypothetical protein